MSLWPHQLAGLAALRPKLTPGAAICCTAPTGGGKSRIMTELMADGGKVCLYTNRRMLLEQIARVLEAAGLRFGFRAANHATDFTRDIQLCSIQTTDARTLKRDKWPMPDADQVFVDEAHINREATACEIIRRHHEQGAAVVGFTATPLNVGHIYNDLVIAGTPRELRDCGALVPAHHFAPDEPDCSRIKRTPTGEYTEGDVRKLIMTHSIFGRVVEHWRALNPEGKPTILFAPGVKESLWFAEQLTANGIPSAHIDGEKVWMDGKIHESDEYARKDLMELSQAGVIKILCNRFVLREGIDFPWLECGIFATIFGALTSFLQSGGRLLRASPSTGKTHATIIDHGGNWYRHGSLNADREWFLDRTDYVVGEMREERLRKKQEPEPIRCPKCNAIRASGPVCKACGFAHDSRSRMVVQLDGSLREVKGDIFRPRRTDRRPEAADIWKRVYYRCKNANKTFAQARGLYQYEQNWASPPDNLPLMPLYPVDWYRRINEVPIERLRSSLEAVA